MPDFNWNQYERVDTTAVPAPAPSGRDIVGDVAASAATGGALGLGAAGVIGARRIGAGPAAQAVGKFALKQFPGVRLPMDVAELAGSLRGGGAPASATAAPTAPAPGSPEARIAEAKAVKMEHDARAAAARADLAEKKAAEPPKRTTERPASKPKPRTQRPPEPVPIRAAAEERKPITVEGKPATRGASQRGVSKRILAQRAQGMAESRLPAPAVSSGDDLMDRLAKSLHVEQGMNARGVPLTGGLASGGGLRKAVRAGLSGAKALKSKGGALAILAALAGLGSMAAGDHADPGTMGENLVGQMGFDDPAMSAFFDTERLKRRLGMPGQFEKRKTAPGP